MRRAHHFAAFGVGAGVSAATHFRALTSVPRGMSIAASSLNKIPSVGWACPLMQRLRYDSEIRDLRASQACERSTASLLSQSLTMSCHIYPPWNISVSLMLLLNHKRNDCWLSTMLVGILLFDKRFHYGKQRPQLSHGRQTRGIEGIWCSSSSGQDENWTYSRSGSGVARGFHSVSSELGSRAN